MKQSEYVGHKISDIPPEFIEEYNLKQSVQTGWFNLRIYVVAMAYHIQVDSLMTSCAHVLRSKDTTRQSQHLVSGSINGAPSNLN